VSAVSPPPEPLRVLKFGGAALATGEGVQRACRIVLERGGPRPVVVVSAHAGVTELLAAAAAGAAGGGAPGAGGPGKGLEGIRIRHRTLLRQLELDGELLDRLLRELADVLAAIRSRAALGPAERDFVLSFGERMSSRIVARCLRRMGSEATPVDAFDLGLTSDSNHGRARPLPGVGRALRSALGGVPGVPVITGFLAVDRRGNLTTLGRNGSDLTASLVGEALGAAEVQYWKLVEAVMTADPELVPDARPLARLSWEEADELARFGARVLHPEAIGPARRAGIPVWLGSVRDPSGPGTRIEGEGLRAGTLALACRADLAEVEIPDRAGEAAERLLEGLGGPAFEGVASRRVEGGRRIAMPEDAALAAAQSSDGRELRVEAGLASAAAIGAGAGRDRIGRAREILADAGIEARALPLRDPARSVLFLLPADRLAEGAARLHALLLAEGTDLSTSAPTAGAR